MKILIIASLAASPVLADAQLSSLLAKAKGALKTQSVPMDGDRSTSSTSSLDAPAVAPVNPQADPTVKDSFITRKDAHGHDYDAKTGYLICLSTPRKYKSAPYAMSSSETKIPEGHAPNLSCISADREFVTI